jgi:RNA polymerase sigma-70 factor (ECF subfamily)
MSAAAAEPAWVHRAMDNGPDADLESSAQLIRRAREGDRPALERLFARYVPPLRRWAAGRLPRWARDLTDTEDLIQDTLLKTFRRLEEFEERPDTGGLHAYLRQALRRRVLDELRRVKRRPPVDELLETVSDPAASPLEETIGIEAAERYERALERLGPAEREAVIARLELGLDYDRIAEALGKPSRDAARMAVARALVSLAREMDDAG